MNPSLDFERRIEGLDLSLFAAIDTQSDDGDKRSWLALQRTARRSNDPYTYLEIGSFLGGSLQPYVLDPRCRKILSIDPRPAAQPDDRGQWFHYENNSTARMLANLRAIDPDQVSKIACFDSDAQEIDPARLADRPDLCFIDGEHTQRAVLSDFDFCLRVCAPRAIIFFHDDYVIHPALARILKSLRKQGKPFHSFKLQGSTFAIALGAASIPDDEFIREAAVDGRRVIRRMRARRIIQRWIPSFLRPIARRVRGLLGGSHR